MAFEKYPQTRLKAAREYKGFSQTFVAGKVGITQSHLAKLEKGKVAASPETATRLATFFGGLVTREEILYPDEYPVVDLPARKGAHQAATTPGSGELAHDHTPHRVGSV